VLLTFFALFFFAACSTSTPADHAANNAGTAGAKDPEELRRAITAIEPFFKPMGEPEGWDWLAAYPERGQTFEEFLNESPTIPTADRRTVYVLPLGRFDPQQDKIIRITAGWLEAFYGLPIKLLPAQKLNEPLKQSDFRKSPHSRNRQVRTGYLLDEVLARQLPPDAAALIAFTGEDLYPDATMNYVFGQASFDRRVGIWSLFRLDDENARYETFLRRTLKIAAHELGHMFTIRHCTKYECVMSGTNHLAETDRHPLDACPECMAKIAHLSKIPPADRYARLTRFSRENRLTNEAANFESKLSALQNMK